jgi:hypothetical protein
MADVFISYSRENRALVAPFATRLTELGVDVWYDREVPSGKSFSSFIHENLDEAKAVLACWSPEAIKSDWVRGEADYAREQGKYVPVFVIPCKLMPPFNQIQTEDLSREGPSNDQAWIKVVERIAELLDRAGVAAAARAFATGDERANYNFARRYPEEPTARKIWAAAEAKHRSQIEHRMFEAKTAAEAKINFQRAAFQECLKAAAPAFESWLAAERRAAADTPCPDPFTLIEKLQRGEELRLHEEIASLGRALARARAQESAAKAEIVELSNKLAAGPQMTNDPCEQPKPLERNGEPEKAKLAMARGTEVSSESSKLADPKNWPPAWRTRSRKSGV